MKRVETKERILLRRKVVGGSEKMITLTMLMVMTMVPIMKFEVLRESRKDN